MPKKELPLEILQDLNTEQERAVTHGQGPLLIIAGAGTGKTTVITRRIAWLILNKLAKPDEILAVTFTDKAAQEMEQRVDILLPYGYTDLWISTFHSFCERVLQDHGLDIGLPLNFKLLNTVQQSFLILDNFDRFDLDYYRPLGNPTKFIQGLVKHFSRAKDELISPSEYLKYAEKLELDKDTITSDELLDSETARLKEVANAYHTYQQLLLDNNSLDFGDLINYTIELFKKRPQILEKYRKQFKYILVDEFQDTNWAQYKLLQMLASPKNNFTVVSDDDQAVFLFRGASYNNVIQFRKDYSKSKQVVLLKNYRSSQGILDLSYKFIQLNNPARLEAQEKNIIKKLKAEKRGEAEISHLHYKTREDEIREIIKKIIKLKGENKSATWNDFAILVRANNQAESFCSALRFADIPYQFLAKSGLFSKPIILDIISYLKLLDNYHESSAIYRILVSPIFNKKISNEDLSNLTYFANKKNWSLYEAMKQSASIPNISKQTVEQLNKFLGWIDKHTQLSRDQSVKKVVYSFLEDSGYLELLTSLAIKDDMKSAENISYLSQFFKRIENFESVNIDSSITNFIRMIDLMIQTGDTGGLDEEGQSGPESVKVSTIHSAKGLEWRWVFIVNLVDRRFPTIHRKEQIMLPEKLIKEIIPQGDVHLQEERRLFYVALTRAKDGLFLTSAEDYGGKTRKKFSRFLYELGFIKKDKTPETKQALDYLQKRKSIPLKGAAIKKQKIELPTKFSFSQLEAFDKCPLQYKFAFILKIPRRGKYTFSFGRSIHKTLHHFLQDWLDQNKPVQSDLFSKGQTKAVLDTECPKLDDLLKIYKDVWIDDWYEDKEHQEKYKKKGREILKMFYDDFKKNPADVKYLEKGFHFGLDKYKIKGVIDRVDKTKQGLEIIDYKTGKSKGSKLNAKDKQQLIIYQLAVQNLPNLFDSPVCKLTYYYLETGERAAFLAKPEELKQTQEQIVKSIEKIKTSDFPPKPSRMCKWCDFYNICEYRYE